MAKKFNYVYVTTCLINNKQYVGSHCTDNIDDNYIGSGRLFLKAVRKHGKENFKREIIEEFNDPIKAREKEGPLIEELNTLDPHGYNLSPKGGIGFKGAKHSESTKKKMSIWQKGKTYIELYGPEKAADMKRKQRENKLGKSTSRKGKGHKQELVEKYGEEIGLIKYNEFIEKQRESHTGKKQSQETIDKRLKTMGEPWNKGKTYKSGSYSKERIEKTRQAQLKSFYNKLDLDKIEIIRELHNQVSINELSRKTGYHFNKVKRIIKEII
jgi:group I intron endonuclease